MRGFFFFIKGFRERRGDVYYKMNGNLRDVFNQMKSRDGLSSASPSH